MQSSKQVEVFDASRTTEAKWFNCGINCFRFLANDFPLATARVSLLTSAASTSSRARTVDLGCSIKF